MPAVTPELFVMVAALALFVVTEALIFTIATFLLLKALLLERRSALGRALGRNNLAMSLAYYSAFFGTWIPVLESPVVRAAVVVLTFVTAIAAIRQFVKTYGGWVAVAAEAGEAAREIAAEFYDNTHEKCLIIGAILERFWRRYRNIVLLLGVLVVLGVLGLLEMLGLV